MADRQLVQPAEGETRLGPGGSNTGHWPIFYVQAPSVPDRPSLLALDAVADGTGARTTWYLWVDSAGDLRIHNAIPTDQDADGTVVGTQT